MFCRGPRKRKLKAWLAVFAAIHSYSIGTARAFAFAFAFATGRIFEGRQRALFYKNLQDDPPPERNSETTAPTEEWTLREDWALVDRLPLFTVGSTESPQRLRTFWTQLAAATPALSRKHPDELWKRCQLLQHNQSLSFGPSPPLLSNWRLDLTSRSTDNRAVGTLEDGRVVWLHYHVVGRLPGDILSDHQSPSLMALIPGGYLEAVGGRIYELGEPSSNDVAVSKASGTSRSLWAEPESVPQNNGSSMTPETTSTTWWLPATTGTVSALLASTVLSACVGYGAGLGIIADTSAPHHHAATMAQPLTNSPAIFSPEGSGVQMIHYKSSSYNSPSLEERMARAEYKVLREERWLKTIAEELERDQADLKGLQTIQFMEQQARADHLLP